MRKTIWLSFDLGVRGDYEGLYSWLEDHGAKECGSSLALLIEYEYEGDLLEALKRDICENISTNRRTRIYVIFLRDGRMKGRFIVGKRKAPPWTGFGSGLVEEFDESLAS